MRWPLVPVRHVRGDAGEPVSEGQRCGGRSGDLT